MALVIRLVKIILLTLIGFLSDFSGLLFTPSQWQREKFLSRCGLFLKKLFERLGPVFVKVGQSLSVRRDILPEHLINPLRDLQDQVSPVSEHCMRTLLEREYGHPLDVQFDEFDWSPIACGSIAQVYRARLKGSQDYVAVKVRRPGIERIVDQDLRLIRWLINLVQKYPQFQKIPIIQSIEHLCHTIHCQLDFHQERTNTETFYRLFQHEKHVIIPQIVSEACRNSVLVMGFQQGLQKIDNLAIQENIFQQAVLTLLRSLYKMIFTYGLIHCDFHPGNIFVNQYNELVILDFGMIARLTDSDRIQFRNFFIAIANNDGKTCADIILKTATLPEKDLDKVLFVNEVCQLIHQVSCQRAGEFRVAEFIYQLFDLQRSYGLYGTPNFTMALVSLILFEGITLHRFPALDFQKEVRPFFTAGIIESVRRSFSSG
jgi:ubiquinone biosynthesis protein